MTGQKEMTAETLEPIMSKMKEHLINKNVAADIAQHLCDSVARGLVGQTLGSFKSKSPWLFHLKTGGSFVR